MSLAMRRIDARHRMYRIAQRSTKLQRERLELVGLAAMVRKKQELLGDALAKSGNRQLRFIEVAIQDGCVVLKGRVKTFYLKQLAQESVRSMAKEMRIFNRIEVA